ncbi:MAG: Lrp/AsnC ligand binding domain-containing protein, partial [Rhodospirillales bacterium]
DEIDQAVADAVDGGDVEFHRPDPAAGRFHRAVARIPEVLECWAVTGDGDYLLRVVAENLKAFSDLLMHQLLALPEVATVRSNIALDRIKQTTALPV